MKICEKSTIFLPSLVIIAKDFDPASLEKVPCSRQLMHREGTNNGTGTAFALTIPSTPINSSGKRNRELRSLLLKSSRTWNGLLKWNFKSQVPHNNSLQVLHLMMQDDNGFSHSVQTDCLGIQFFLNEGIKKVIPAVVEILIYNLLTGRPFLILLAYTNVVIVINVLSKTLRFFKFCFTFLNLTSQYFRP